MSIFKIKKIWNATYPEQEFDQRHIAFGQIYKIPTLIVGSYKGTLRVYSFNPNTKYANKCFNISYEKQFDEPIIDIKFVAHPDESMKGNTIGVLLFRKFVYLTLLQNKQKPSMYQSRIMNVQVQPSFAIISSSLSLATLNSTIQTLNPKEIHPIKQSDSIYSFVVQNENMYYMDGQDLVMTKGSIEQWRIVVGRVRKLILPGGEQNVIIVIGEVNLWQVIEGKIVKCKHLQEQVSTACLAYKSPSNKSDFNIVVCNFMTQMLIYSRDYALLWAVKLDYVPINIMVSDSQNLKGALIMLTDQGTAEVTYLGTEVQERQLRVLQQEVSMEMVEKQTAFYLQKLKQLKSLTGQPQQTKNQQQKTVNSSTYLTIKPSFSQPTFTTQFVDNSDQYLRSAQNQLIKCVLNVQIIAHSTQLTDCILTVQKPNNIYCTTDQYKFQKLRGKQSVKIQCYISKQKFPYEKQLKINVRYQKGKSTNFISQSVAIPIAFQCQIQSFQSMQSAESKITFKCTDIPLPPFNSLFGDIMQRGCGEQKKAITFRLANGVKTSIVYNKNLTKAKIQSEVYSGMCFIFIEFISRIQAYLQKEKLPIKPVQVEVPLKQLQQQIRDYFTFRQNLKKQYGELQFRIEEFKKAQKKLLLKMKQKNSQLEHINKLLEYTHLKILETAEKYEQLLQETNIVNHNFEVSLKLVMQLVYKRSAATQKAIELAESILRFNALTENVHDEQGWAQRLTKNTAYYLNKKYEPTLQNLQKLVTWVITKVNNGDWNNM